jgi:hypothetical protein
MKQPSAATAGCGLPDETSGHHGYLVFFFLVSCLSGIKTHILIWCMSFNKLFIA